jgi:PAS domain S-box-containing protein
LGGSNALAHLAGGTNLTIHPTDVLLSFGHAAQGELLYGSRGKFYRVPTEQPAEVIEVNLPVRDSIYSVIKEAGRSFWLGTGSRAFRFQPDPAPPLTEAACPAPTVVAGGLLMVDVWGRRPFQSLRERQDFHFTWRVDGGAWSPFKRIHKLPLETAAIPPGRHTLEIRARDTSLVTDPVGASLAFEVLPKPLQSHAWFRPVAGLFVLGFSLLAIRVVQTERKLADYGKNLERMVRERTAAERSLIDQERTYRLLFEANPHPMWVYDQATFAFLAVNEAALKTYGYSREEFTRMTLRDILPPGEQSSALITLTDLPPKPTHIGIARLRKKDGAVFLADIYSTALHDHSGRSVRLGTSIDLNDRVHLEEQLQQLHQLGSINGLPKDREIPPA